MTEVCPWCQTELVWDEDLGPEPSCPHCFNELGEYRTLSLPVKRGKGADSNLFEEERSDAWSEYTRAAEAYLDAQEDVPECPQCQEYMVHAGEQLVPEHQFAARALAGLSPFVKAPFKLSVYVCSNCFAVMQRLSDEDKRALIRRLADIAAD